MVCSPSLRVCRPYFQKHSQKSRSMSTRRCLPTQTIAKAVALSYKQVVFDSRFDEEHGKECKESMPEVPEDQHWTNFLPAKLKEELASAHETKIDAAMAAGKPHPGDLDLDSINNYDEVLDHLPVDHPQRGHISLYIARRAEARNEELGTIEKHFEKERDDHLERKRKRDEEFKKFKKTSKTACEAALVADAEVLVDIGTYPQLARGRLVSVSHADKTCTVKIEDEVDTRCVDRDRIMHVLEGENWIKLCWDKIE